MNAWLSFNGFTTVTRWLLCLTQLDDKVYNHCMYDTDWFYVFKYIMKHEIHGYGWVFFK